MAISVVNSGSFVFDFSSGGGPGTYSFTLGWTPAPGNTLVIAASSQSYVGTYVGGIYTALGIASIEDSNGNFLASLSQESIDYFAGPGATNPYQNASQIWYLTTASAATGFTVVLTGGQSTHVSYGDLAVVFFTVFEITPAVFDSASSVAIDATTTNFSGPTVTGTGTDDFYVVAFGAQPATSTVSVAGWTVLTGATYADLDVTAYLISTGAQATSFAKTTFHASFPYYPISGAAFKDNSVTLVSILVTPFDPAVTPGGTQQFTATGTYSDTSTQNLTSSAAWTSSTTPVATIAAGGLATGVAVGSSTITATSGTISGSTLLTVDGPRLPPGQDLSERSFACNGCFESSSAYGDVLKSLALSMAGFVVPPGDCWRVYAGAYVPPSVTLSDGDCRSSIKGDFRLSSRDTCNGVKGQYIPGFLPINPLGPLASSPASSAWKKTDFPPVQRANYIAEDAGIILWKDIQLDFTISLWMAQRIARIILERLRRQVTVSVPAKLTGLALLAADTMQFLHTRWAGVTPPVPTVFQVSHTALRMESQADGVPAFGVDLMLRQTDAAVYEFAPPTSPTAYGDYSPYGQTGIGAGNVE